jgi:hypothetical protein
MLQYKEKYSKQQTKSSLNEIFEYFISVCCKHIEMVLVNKKLNIITMSENNCSEAYEDDIFKKSRTLLWYLIENKCSALT